MSSTAEGGGLCSDWGAEGCVTSGLTDGTLQSAGTLWGADWGLQEKKSELRCLSFFLLIFTKSLWYPPLPDPVRGDSREVLKNPLFSPHKHILIFWDLCTLLKTRLPSTAATDRQTNCSVLRVLRPAEQRQIENLCSIPVRLAAPGKPVLSSHAGL